MYEISRDECHAATERVHSSANKPPEKQRQFQEEQAAAEVKFNQDKANFRQKAVDVEQRKQAFLKNTLVQYSKQIESGQPADPGSLQVPTFEGTPRRPSLASSFDGDGPAQRDSVKSIANSRGISQEDRRASTQAASSSANLPTDVVASLSKNAPTHVTALYDYTALSDLELSFKAHDVIRVVETAPDGWWTGEVFGKKGQFPITYVDVGNQ